MNSAVIGTQSEQLLASLERILHEFPVQPFGQPFAAVVQRLPHQFVADECSIEQTGSEYLQPLRRVALQEFALQLFAIQRGQGHQRRMDLIVRAMLQNLLCNDIPCTREFA